MAGKKSERAATRARQESGQGLSISTIVIAAIALIVLVVLVAVFTGQMGKWLSGVETQKKGLSCEGASPDGLAGRWSSEPCAAGKQLFGVSNSEDVRTHAGMVCCAS